MPWGWQFRRAVACSSTSGTGWGLHSLPVAPCSWCRSESSSSKVAFRGVLWGLLEVEHGAAWASAVSSVLFGAWHVLPAVDGVRATSDRDEPMARGALIRQVAATVVFTTVAGLVFALLRQQAGPARALPPAGRPTGWASSRPPGRGGPAGTEGQAAQSSWYSSHRTVSRWCTAALTRSSCSSVAPRP